MKLTRFIFTAFTATLLSVGTTAQTTYEEMSADLNKTGGVYFAYPTVKADNTPAPKGYVPFHISHYGRHGSRYLISDYDYEWIAALLGNARDAGALTPLGENILLRIDSLMIETKGRGGDLSPLGRRQHRAIADNMYRNYPQVFGKNTLITARSTLVPRCILSMTAFCEKLKENNRELWIDMESSNRYMPYLCHSTQESDRFNAGDNWYARVLDKMKQRNTKSERLIDSIFSNTGFVKKYVNDSELMWGLYWIASDAQNTEGHIDFYDLFTPQELFDLWQCSNALFYGKHALYRPAGRLHAENARPLLANVLATAEEAIENDNPTVALRFGHDGNVVPFAALLGLDNADAVMDNEDEFFKGWCDWKVSPMAANIQFIFFRNKANPKDVILKVLHNEKETHIPVETDMWPFYRWTDVKNQWMQIIGR